MKSKFLFAFAAVAFTLNAQAAVYSTGFESFPNGGDVAGHESWTINDPTANLSTVATWVRPTTSSKAASLGFGDFGYQTTMATVDLAHAYGEPVVTTDNIGSSISFDLGLVDSTNTNAVRDTFGIALRTSTGNNIFSVTFTPTSQSATPDSATAIWAVSYTVGASAPVSTGYGAEEGGPYLFNLTFSPNGATTNFNLSVDNGRWSGSTAFAPNQVIDSYHMTWTPTNGIGNAGSNAIIIDNLVMVPEASTSLLLCLAGASLVARRRRN
ncbi:MAG: PEP-CTERM sorting domain-containing protein [Verrucomicrobiota bacterium]